MVTQIFLNLPVKNLPKSIAFFTALGFTFNPQFTDETATCMIIGENIFAMLLTEEKFRTFTKKEVVDAHKSGEAIFALQLESKEEVDAMIRKAEESGATLPMPIQDYGWMYQHGFTDLDGHQWEVFFMDVSKIPAQA